MTKNNDKKIKKKQLIEDKKELKLKQDQLKQIKRDVQDMENEFNTYSARFKHQRQVLVNEQLKAQGVVDYLTLKIDMDNKIEQPEKVEPEKV